MRKFILFLAIFLLVSMVGIFFGRNMILKYVLEDRLGQMNQAYVKIGSVDSNFFENYISLRDIQVESHEKAGTDFIHIQQVKTYYNLDYNHKKVELFDTEIIGLQFITPKDEEDMRALREAKAVEVVSGQYPFAKIFKEESEREEQKEVLEVKFSDEYQKIKDAVQDMKNGEHRIRYHLNTIRENIEKLREKYIKPEVVEEPKSILSLDRMLGKYLTIMYEDKIYNLLLRYREIVKEMEERVRRDVERRDDIWEIQMNRVSIFFDIYGINFNGEIKNFNSRLSKNYDNISFKLFGEKGDTIGMIKGELNLLKLDLQATLDIPELNLTGITEFRKYLSDGVASLQQDIQMDKYDVALQGILTTKRMKLVENPLLEKIQDLEIRYRYNSRDRQLYLNTNFLKNKIDEMKNN
ncbi:hypothetical protein EGX98_09985 [Fusobacterium necrophorum]|uniref:Uncharacterized protein n=2 Tax=Fusobacterium necrophorum TaxID=859 RepID=A0AB73C4W2_9FUSO|nr:hypothetical protein [Fusobacterium necrophorum]AYZ74333.1 hypothetical protein EGX98_09985 [Fusobacterium necrophorum]AZW09781.1 hypothetical protein EO219_09575 [Fusobacterium necrophorum subsp. necrophorum]KDE64561.1 hypothetical protein FUSO5_06090 [Fusobacterium necrophorum BFTR-1]KDE66091.1 hypothetical protein FUSO4_05295 [Fusobacterium necrophorum DJ-1]KDE71379.1 hypothetical protein FUSO6_01160 [Fusobacterium necrophorum DAB]